VSDESEQQKMELNERMIAQAKQGLAMVMLRVHKCPKCEGKRVVNDGAPVVQNKCCGGLDQAVRFGKTRYECFGVNCTGIQRTSVQPTKPCDVCDGRGWLWRDEFIAGMIETNFPKDGSGIA